MTDTFERGSFARAVFSGLTPTGGRHNAAEPATGFRSTRWRRGVMAGVPIVLAGAMTVTFNLTGPLESASAAPKRPAKPRSELAKTLREILLTSAKSNISTAPAPTSYTVVPGDSVSSIAGRYGVSTASVLALNGLSWKSLIFPGQVLKLSAATPATAPTPAASTGGRYTVVSGDTVSAIAARFGVTTQAVLSANGLGWSSIIYPGQTIAIPAGTGANAPSAASAAAPAAPAPVSSSYKIVAGDTLSALAVRFGTTTAAIMAANSMGSSTIIYSGRTLVIPTASAAAPVLAATTASAVTTGAVTPLTEEMAANARLIIQIGQKLGVPDRGIVVALAAAMQETGLRNLDYGDRDSIGMFQQRPSTGWGTDAQLLDPTYATELFYGGPSNPNAGRTRGLLDIANWQSMTVAQAAQAVQISAFPDAYGAWESSAWVWLAQYR